MATVNANTVALYLDDAGGNFTADPAESTSVIDLEPIMFSTSASISISNATYEATSITNNIAATTRRDFAVGTQSTTLSVEGVVDWATATNQVDLDALFDAFLAKTRVTAVWASTDTNIQAYGGKGFLTSFEMSSAVDDFATFSASIELDGDVQQV